MRLALFINGKFLLQPTTGVQRVARQLVLALDALAPEPHDAPPPVLLVPPGADPLPLARIHQRTVRPAFGAPDGRAGARALHQWEQTSLPRAARGGLLLNLAGSAPWLARRQAAVLHDAAVFDQPQAYTAAFVRWYRALFGHLARRAEALFTVSSFSRGRLEAALPVSRGRWQVLHNGADHLAVVEPDGAVLDRLGLRDRVFLLAVGSDNPTKNLGALVQAHAALPPGRPPLVLVGGANARVFASAPTGRAADVLRCGLLGDAPLKALYGAAAALVFPSLYEGFGLPPLEAMACGCPALVSDGAPMDEVCGDAALRFDPRSPASITACIAQRLAMDAGAVDRLRRAGRAQAEAFTWKRAARALRQRLHDAGVAA